MPTETAIGTKYMGNYLPGDVIAHLSALNNVTILGPGLRRNEERLNALNVTQAGELCFKSPSTYWIESRRNRYIPKQGDLVVGIIAKKAGDSLRLDIGSAEFAVLSMMAFEGATKKQKPDVDVGDVIYAQVLSAHREMEPELVCIDSYFKAGKLGVLSNDGFLINLPIKLVHRLLNPGNPLLRTLGKKFPFELAIGVNGKVWINAKKSKDVMTLIKAFYAMENQDEKDIIELCRQQK